MLKISIVVPLHNNDHVLAPTGHLSLWTWAAYLEKYRENANDLKTLYEIELKLLGSILIFEQSLLTLSKVFLSALSFYPLFNGYQIDLWISLKWNTNFNKFFIVFLYSLKEQNGKALFPSIGVTVTGSKNILLMTQSTLTCPQCTFFWVYVHNFEALLNFQNCRVNFTFIL